MQSTLDGVSRHFGGVGADPWAAILLHQRSARGAFTEPHNFEKLDYGCPDDSVYRQTNTTFNNELSTLADAAVRL